MARKTPTLPPLGLTLSPTGSKPSEGFFCKALIAVPSKSESKPGLTTATVQFPYTGLHTDAALETARQAFNTLSLTGNNLRRRLTESYGVVVHLSHLALCDRLGRTLRVVKGPVFEVVA
jgi:hypothetical protein